MVSFSAKNDGNTDQKPMGATPLLPHVNVRVHYWDAKKTVCSLPSKENTTNNIHHFFQIKDFHWKTRKEEEGVDYY